MSRIKMPHNNRVSSSAALKMNSMWSKTIGYDPYASTNEVVDKGEDHAASLMLLARMSNLSGVESRGNCKRCGMLGHLTFQCRNPVKQEDQVASGDNSDNESSSESEQEVVPIPVAPIVEPSSTKKRSREADSDDDKSTKSSRSGSDSSTSSEDSSRAKKHKKKSHKSHKKKSSKHHKKSSSHSSSKSKKKKHSK